MEKSIFQKLYSPKDFNSLGNTAVQALGDHIASTTLGKTKKTINWNVPKKELEFWKDFLENGNGEDFIPEVLKHTIHTHNPRYMGHQVAAPAPITALTAMVSSILNNGMAVFEMGMAPSAIEQVVVESICKKIGYDGNSGGFLTSGGTLANLTALLSARRAIVKQDVWNEGHSAPLGIMVCEEAHYCADRAAKIMGLGEKGIIRIPASENFGMDTTLLDRYYMEAASKGIEIFAIIGSAPSTATGAYDNLDVLSKFAQQKQIWFHVDGAHGGAAIYSEKYKHLLQGIVHADSIVIDGHKMMLMPTITTALLFKDKKHAQDTFNQRADYLLDDVEEEDWINSGKKTFECTKTMMCLHWFVLLKHYGDALFDEFVTRQYDLAKTFEKMLIEDPKFQLATSPQSNILCFRCIEKGKTNEELNAWNAAIRQRLLEDGEFYIVQTKLRGIRYLRTTLMSPFTTKDHLRQLVKKIKAVAASIN